LSFHIIEKEDIHTSHPLKKANMVKKEYNKTFEKRILVTGGAGFIGSHLVRYFVNTYPNYLIINLDKLTYAGNLNNISDVSSEDNYVFIECDIASQKDVLSIFEQYDISDVIHLAAESHVDRSITSPLDFVTTNVLGTVILLQTAQNFWQNSKEHVFYHVSTDEVYGSLNETGFFTEQTAYDPRSPYSASKASSDHFVRAFHHTYNLPIKISNCSNNYGTHHYPEKLIPLVINNIIKKLPIPIYGSGNNVRDWLWVGDHVRAIDLIFHKGRIGESYNVGGNNEWKNKDLVILICRLMDEKLNRKNEAAQQLITYVPDRKGHDLRYAIDANKIQSELGWIPTMNFEDGLRQTIDWYIVLDKFNTQ